MDYNSVMVELFLPNKLAKYGVGGSIVSSTGYIWH